MANYVPVDKVAHRDLKVRSQASAELGDGRNFVQAVISEFPQLAIQYPIMLTKDSETGAFLCGAVLGYDADENLFLREGGGYEGYRPLALRRDPFVPAGEALAIDLDSPRISDDGDALFVEEGEPSPYLQETIRAVHRFWTGLEETNVFIAALSQHRLIAPVEIKLHFDDGSSRDLAGLYSINEETLEGLESDTVVELFRNGYLHLISLMRASVKHIPVLAQKKNERIVRGV